MIKATELKTGKKKNTGLRLLLPQKTEKESVHLSRRNLLICMGRQGKLVKKI